VPHLGVVDSLFVVIFKHGLHLSFPLFDALSHYETRLLQLAVFVLMLVVSGAHCFELRKDHVVDQIRILLNESLKSTDLRNDLLQLLVTLAVERVLVLVRLSQMPH